MQHVDWKSSILDQLYKSDIEFRIHEKLHIVIFVLQSRKLNQYLIYKMHIVIFELQWSVLNKWIDIGHMSWIKDTKEIRLSSDDDL